MMNSDLTFDENCKFSGTEKMVDGGIYPFPSEDGSEITEVPCVHCSRLTGLTEERGGKHYGVVAMAANQKCGLIACYTADGLRALADSLIKMADHCDEENGVK